MCMTRSPLEVPPSANAIAQHKAPEITASPIAAPRRVKDREVEPLMTVLELGEAHPRLLRLDAGGALPVLAQQRRRSDIILVVDADGRLPIGFEETGDILLTTARGASAPWVTFGRQALR